MHLFLLACLTAASAAEFKPLRPSEIALTPESAAEVALDRSPALKSVRARARADAAAARAEGRPEDPRFTGAFKSGDGDGRTEIGLSFDLWSLIGYGGRRRAASAEAGKADALMAEAALALAAEAKAAVYEVEAASATLVLRREQAEAVRGAAASGGYAERIAWGQAALDAGAAEAELEATRSRLARLMRVPVNSGWWTKADLPAPLDAEPGAEALTKLALERRPALAAALAGAKAAQERANAWSASSAGALRAGVALEKEPNGKRLAGPSFEMDLPLFGGLAPKLDALDARAEQASADADEAEAELAAELETLAARLSAARRAENILRAVILPAREAAAADARGKPALLAAREALASSRREWIAARRDYWVTRSALERAVGGSLP